MNSLKALTAVVAALALIGPACSKDSSSPTTTGGSNNTSSINSFVASLPDWKQPPDYLTSGTAAAQTITMPGDAIPDYQCTVQSHDWAKADNEVFAPEQDFATVWPGAMFHGDPYRTGTLTPVDAPRSPITMYSNLPGSKSVTVDNPTSTTMNDAVNEIRGSVAAGNYQSAWEFRVDEVYSNLQGSMEAGLTAGYSGVASGGLNFSENRTITHHVYFGRAVQRMYTIRFADDQLKTPSDFFDGSMTAQQLRDAGIGDSDVPVYVRSVTYGQMIVFKAELTTDQSGSSFKADLKASWDDFTAGGSGGSSNGDLLKQATYTAIGYGGDPGNSANAHSAVADQKFGTFFDGATVQNAVPLFFEVVTLKGGKPASLGEHVVYQTWENCKAATGYTVTTKFNRIKANAKTDEKAKYELDLYCGVAAIIPHSTFTSLMNFPLGNHWYSVNKTANCSMSTAALGKFIVQFSRVSALTAATYSKDYPFTNVPRNTWISLLPTAEITDGILPNSPKRTITADVQIKLVPTYD
jgi:Thiol-activated cytolysin